MVESNLSWLHPLPLCTSVVVQQKNLMSRGKLKSHLASTVGRKQDKEAVEEFSKQSTELKKNTNNIRRQAKQREEEDLLVKPTKLEVLTKHSCAKNLSIPPSRCVVMHQRPF